MTAYGLYKTYDYEESYLVGVFLTEKLADEYLNKMFTTTQKKEDAWLEKFKDNPKMAGKQRGLALLALDRYLIEEIEIDKMYVDEEL